MIEFWNGHKPQIIWAFVVIILFFLLRFLTQKLHSWLEKRAVNKNRNSEALTINLTHRILNALWLVLGIMALSWIFVPEQRQQAAFGDFRLVAYLGFVAVFTLVTASLIQRWFNKSIDKIITNKQDPTSYKFLRYVAVFSVYFLGVLMAILAFPSLRVIAHTALGGAGVIAIVAGIASQEALANVVAGVFIIAFKPFKLGDVVKISDLLMGTVTDITLRHTVIRNYENKMIVVPNSIMSKEKIINYDLGERVCCEWIEVGISYDSDIDLAKHIIREECETHPNLLDHRSELDLYNNVPKVIVRVIGLDDSAVTIRAWCWASSFPEAFVLKCDLLESIKKRFDKEGVEIPFPHRTMVFKEKQLAYLKEELASKTAES
ncbi:MAG: mechanosensitive ion channel family protein [Leeuwenhoekiella sp.]